MSAETASTATSMRARPDVAQAIQLLKNLVAFDTTSRNSNLELIAYVRDYLSALGVESTLVYDAKGGKANLYATLGDPSKAGLCLSGHTDVVPATEPQWTSSPFSMVEREGRLYGRGTADMKGFLACVLGAVPMFTERCTTLPVHLAFSYDEEIGCVGVRGLLEMLARAKVKPAACLIGEPTLMSVATAHKGKRAVRCTVHGKTGHSAMPELGVNAVTNAAALIGHLDAQAQALRRSGLRHPTFTPPYSTVHVGRVRGGVAVNVVPDACEFDYEIRSIPGENVEKIEAEVRNFAQQHLLPGMHAVDNNTQILFEELSAYPALAGASPEAARLADWVLGMLPESKPKIALSFGSEAGLFEQILQIPAIVCGPGSIDDAHKPNEFVDIDQLAACCTLLTSIGDRLARGEAGWRVT